MVVVDSFVLIHLCRIGKLSLLKKFFKKIGITQEVYGEVKGGIGFSEIEKACKNWIFISRPVSDNADNTGKLEGIEKADASIILLAKETNDTLLSNDYALIMVARSKGVKCWWLTTFLLGCLEKKIITKKEAEQILFELIESGMRLDNAVYAAILKQIRKYNQKNF